MKYRIIFILTILLFSACNDKNLEDKDKFEKSYTFSSPKETSIEFQISKLEISTDERIKLKIIIRYRPEIIPVIDDWNSWEIPFNLIYYKENDNLLNNNEMIVKIFDLLLEPDLPGNHFLPPLIVEFNKKNEFSEKIITDYIPIKVNSVLLEGESELIDDNDIIRIKNTFRIPVIVAGGGFLLIAFFSVWFIRKRNKPGKDEVIPIEEQFLVKLEKIKEEHEIFYDYYYQLSSLLREYLDYKYPLLSSSQTTEEFIESNRENQIIEEWLKPQLFSFFIKADRIKFGLITSGKEGMEGDFKLCKDIMGYINNKSSKEVTNEL